MDQRCEDSSHGPSQLRSLGGSNAAHRRDHGQLRRQYDPLRETERRSRRSALAVLRAQLLFCFGDQLLDFLAALMPDLFVKIRAVLFFDDLAAFLPDGLVELDAVTVARGFSALATDVLIKRRAVAVAYGVAALLAGLAHGHLALGGVVVFVSHRSLLRDDGATTLQLYAWGADRL